MNRQTRRRLAGGLLAAAGGLALYWVVRRAAPKMMRSTMRSMMREMMNGECGFDPPEM